MRVLIIEDDGDLREALEGVFEFGEFLCEVQGTEHGQSALEYLRALPLEELPDFILLDLAMPVMNGFEFRTAQLADARLCGIPVVVASGSLWNLEDLERLSADFYLKKPFSPLDIDRIVRYIANISQTQKTAMLTRVGKRRRL